MADALKAKGNAAFAAGEFNSAVALFSQAIELDPSNHVLYSNRSAASSSIKDFSAALVDAQKCVDLKPDWGKGYSRLGAAHHGLAQWDLSIAAFEKGLALDPSDHIRSGLAAARGEQSKVHGRDPTKAAAAQKAKSNSAYRKKIWAMMVESERNPEAKVGQESGGGGSDGQTTSMDGGSSGGGGGGGNEALTLSKKQVLQFLTQFDPGARLSCNLGKVPGLKDVSNDTQLDDVDFEELKLLLDLLKREEAVLDVLGTSTFPGSLIGQIQRVLFSLDVDIWFVGCTGVRLLDLEQARPGAGRDAGLALLHILKAIQEPGIGACPWTRINMVGPGAVSDLHLPPAREGEPFDKPFVKQVNQHVMAAIVVSSHTGSLPGELSGRDMWLSSFADYIFGLCEQGIGQDITFPGGQLSAIQLGNAAVECIEAARRLEKVSGGMLHSALNHELCPGRHGVIASVIAVRIAGPNVEIMPQPTGSKGGTLG
eukprot:gene28061-31164_t